MPHARRSAARLHGARALLAAATATLAAGCGSSASSQPSSSGAAVSSRPGLVIIDASDRLTVTAGTAAIVMQIDGFGPGATPVPAATSQGMLRVEITITADTGNAGPVTLPFAEPQISVDDANQSDFLTCVISPPVPGQCFPIGGLPSWIRPGFGEVEFDPLSPGQSVTGYFFWDPLEPLPHGIPLQDIHLWVDDGNSEVQIPAAGA